VAVKISGGNCSRGEKLGLRVPKSGKGRGIWVERGGGGPTSGARGVLGGMGKKKHYG